MARVSFGLFSTKGAPQMGYYQTRRKCTGPSPSKSMISIMLQCNFIEITLLRLCSLVNWLYIFRTPLHNNTLWGILLLVTPN